MNSSLLRKRKRNDDRFSKKPNKKRKIKKDDEEYLPPPDSLNSQIKKNAYDFISSPQKSKYKRNENRREKNIEIRKTKIITRSISKQLKNKTSDKSTQTPRRKKKRIKKIEQSDDSSLRFFSTGYTQAKVEIDDLRNDINKKEKEIKNLKKFIWKRKI